MERIDLTNSAFPSYLHIWIGYKWDQCLWLTNDETLSKLLFSLKRQRKVSLHHHIFAFYYISTLSYRCTSPMYSVIYIIQTPFSNISIFSCIMKPKLNAFSILKTSSIQKHGSSSLFITSLIFLNIFDFFCIVVSFTN